MASVPRTPGRLRLGSWLTVALVLKALSSEGNTIAKPGRESVDMTRCLGASLQLLEAASGAWLELQGRLTNSFNCTYENMDIEDVTAGKAATIEGCLAVATFTEEECEQRSRKPVDESQCLQGIQEDLVAYKEELNQERLTEAIDNMLMALNFQSNDRQTPVASSLTSQSFKANLIECKLTLALRLRAVTITRIVNYLKSLKESRA